MSLTGVCYECFIGLYNRSVSVTEVCYTSVFRCLSGVVHRQVCFDVLVWYIVPLWFLHHLCQQFGGGCSFHQFFPVFLRRVPVCALRPLNT